MKKLIVSITGIVMVAMASSAASMNWGTNGSGAPIEMWNSTAGLTSGYDVLLVWDQTGAGLGLTKDIGTGTVTFGANVKVEVVNAIGGTAGRVTQTAASDALWLAGTTVNNIYIVAFNGNNWEQASLFAAEKANITFPAAATPAPLPPVFSLATSAQRITSSEWGTITPVPEPTSLALLAIGVGAVALRRRFMRK